MKKLFNLILIVALGTVLFSCSKDKDDDQATENGINGIWANPDYPDEDAVLITDECWIWSNHYELETWELVPYINASYETLIKEFEPDYDFNIYRYDKKNNYYLLYCGITDLTTSGERLYAPKPLILKVNFSNSNMKYIEYCYDESPETDGLVSRDEIMTNNKYATIDESKKLHRSDFEDRYIRFK